MEHPRIQAIEKFIDGLSRAHSRAVVLTALILYAVGIYILYPTVGLPIGVLAVLPVSLVGVLLGQTAGILSSLVTLAITLIVYALREPFSIPFLLVNGLIPSTICLVFFGCLTGWLHDQSELIRGQLAEKEEIARALRRRDDILEAVSYAARCFLQLAEWEQAIADVLKRLGQATGASHVYLFENQVDEAGRLTYVISNGWTAPEADNWIDPVIGQVFPDSGYFHRFEALFRRGETIFGTLESFEDEEQEHLAAYGIRSVAFVPVASEQTWWGFIGFDDCQTSRMWTAAEIEALETAADILGASKHARQVKEAERQERVLAEALRDTAAVLNSSLDLDDVLDQILACAERVVPFNGINLMMIEDGYACTVRCRGYAERGLRDAVLALRLPIDQIPNYREMIQARQPLLISNTQGYPGWISMEETRWIASYVAAPLIIKDEVIGFLNLDSNVPGFFKPEHIERLKAFGNQAAVAIENARLFAETEQNTLNSRFLNEITHAALSAANLEEMLRQIANHLIEMFHADGVYLTEWDEKNGIPVPRAAAGYLSETYPFLRFAVGQANITAQVLSSGRIYVAEDGPDESVLSASNADMFRNRAVIGLPLITGEQKLGVALITFSKPHHFTPTEITLGIQATGQLALAIAKARLLEIGNERILQLTRANNLISALGRVAARIETAAVPDGVITTLGEQISRLGLDCWVALRDPNHPTTMSLRYITIARNASNRYSRWKNLGLNSFPLTSDRFSFYDRVVTRRQAIFLDSPQDVVLAMFPGLDQRHIDQVTLLALANSQTKGIYAPLTIEEQVIGLLLVWGENLLEGEVPAVSIFASQVAIAIQNTQLYLQVQKLALTDELTGLSNRRELFELGQREVEIAHRFERPLSILMIDIDHFKKVNDQHGHAAGDVALRVIASRLREVVREVDIVSRYGGEEFVILLLENQLGQAGEIAERIRRCIADNPIPIDHQELQITVSLGVAELDEKIHSLNELIDIADQALYQAKQTGRNRCFALQSPTPIQ
ncbi:MAG TPA: diguanylate cyclase [Anaerolineaceae bacterium]